MSPLWQPLSRWLEGAAHTTWLSPSLLVALSVVEVAVTVHLYRKIYYQRFRALMVYLIGEAVSHAIGALWYPFAGGVSQPFRMAIRFWVAVEVFRFGCYNLNLRKRWRLAGEALTISGTAAWLVSIATRLTPLENFLVFRGYYHIILMVGLWWISLRVRRSAIAENQDHWAYRIGILRWFTVVGLCGMFVKGGAGYWIFPFTNVVSWWVNVISLILLAANAAWMGWQMTSRLSCLRPDVAYKGKGWLPGKEKR